MAESSLNSPGADASQQRQRLTFGPFTLDLRRAELLRDGQALPLRPKAFDLLTVLATRPGQVLSKDELVLTVWPGVVVSDDSLTQCVHELRSALGDAGPALLRTIPRRGYRFDADVRAEPPPAPPAPPAPSAPSVPAVLPAVAADAPASTARARLRLAPGVLGIALLSAALLLAAVAWLDAGGLATRGQTPAELARAPLPREVPPLSIIVLPLTTEGDAPADTHLADALHGDLINQVARLQSSLVISRDTAATYKGRAADPRQVAREMGVRHVVQGRLSQEGATVRLNIALIDGETGAQRWADTLVADRARLAQTVSDFAVAIERTLAAELIRTTAERRGALSPAEVTADDLAIQGYALWYRGVTRDNVLAAQSLFDRALAIDPDSARAWAGIQFTTANLLLNNWAADRPATVRRHEEATTNLQRVDRDGSPTYSAKTMQRFVERDFPALLRVTTEWTERYRLPLSLGAHGAALYLNGRFDEAVPVLERALRLGPRDPFRAEWQYRLALAHFGAAHYELARDWSQTAAITNAALVWPPIHAAALHRLGRHDEARQALAEHMRRHPGFTAAQAMSRLPSQEPGFVEARERLLGSLRELGLR
jgi:DNA-binding winged helix-turn-helix (wHTH) protein/TolB-like protein